MAGDASGSRISGGREPAGGVSFSFSSIIGVLERDVEQDQRGITQRDYPMRGFDAVGSATRFCSAHDAPRDRLRYRRHRNEAVSRADQRRLFQDRWGEVCAMMQAASAPCGRGYRGLTRATARLRS